MIEDAAEQAVLRPLIGMDKIEITEQAQQIGSFTTSIRPDQDCCKLFVPLHPSTKTRLDDILRVERSLEISAFVKQGIGKGRNSHVHLSFGNPIQCALPYQMKVRVEFPFHRHRNQPIRNQRLRLNQ